MKRKKRNYGIPGIVIGVATQAKNLNGQKKDKKKQKKNGKKPKEETGMRMIGIRTGKKRLKTF